MEELNQMQSNLLLLFSGRTISKADKKLNGSCFTAEKFTLTETRHRGTLFNCITFQTEEYIISEFEICSKECGFFVKFHWDYIL